MLINRNVIITTTELNTGDIIAAGDHLIARVVGQEKVKILFYVFLMVASKRI